MKTHFTPKAAPLRIAIVIAAVLLGGCSHQRGNSIAGVDRVELDRPMLGAATTTPLEPVTPRAVRSTLQPAPASAGAGLEMQTSAPDAYVVKKGDTLWDIAGRFLKTPWRWPELWHANPEIKNPHLIYPGDRITLFYEDGQPRLGINRVAGNGSDGRLVPSIRSQELVRGDTGIPIQTVRPFLVYPDILPEEQLQQAAHVVDSQDEHLIFGAGNHVYVRGLQDTSLGARYNIYRQGNRFVDPTSGEFLGFEAMHAGEAEVTRGGDPATVLLVETVREVLRGDRLIPAQVKADDYYFVPHAAPAARRGEIISLVDALNQAAGYQVAVINLGKRDNIEEGHVFAINQRGRVVKDRFAHGEQSKLVTLPEERTGLLMVFRSFDKISYGLIMEAERPIRVGDAAVTP